MPKPGINTKKDVNPFPFGYASLPDPKTGLYVKTRVVSPQVPEYILNTGNLAVLQSFYEQNKGTLTAADHKYMKARLNTAWKVDRYHKQALKDIGQRVDPPKPEITTKKGFSGIDIKYSGPQTSNNGCWSQGMSLLLKSRGIDLSQEEIRAWRPDMNMEQARGMSANRRSIMEQDTANSVYENADLVQEVLPNSALNQVTINALPENFYLSSQKPLDKTAWDFMTEGEQKEAERRYNAQYAGQREEARKVYKQALKKQLGDMVRNALEKDKSPVLLNISGHYVTVTGISKHGNRLRIEDSRRSLDKTTQTMSVDELIENHVICRPGREVNGIQLTWLKDIPAPEYEQRKTQQTKVYDGVPNASSVSEDGVISIREPQDSTVSAYRNGSPNLVRNGQINGQELSDVMLIPHDEYKTQLNGAKLYADDSGPELYPKGMYFGSQQTYLPKKVYFKGDPELNAGAIEQDSLNKQKETAREINDTLKNLPQHKLRPDEGTFGAFVHDNKHELMQQTQDPGYFIANIYAANKLLAGKDAPENGDKNSLLMSQEDKDAVKNLASTLGPIINSMFEKAQGAVKLPVMACDNDPNVLNREVDNYQNRYKTSANSDMEERKKVIDDAFAAMEATGTGKNYLGIKRSKNHGEFDEMMTELAAYKRRLAKGEVPEGSVNYNLTQKMLKYIEDKKGVRSTETGAIRFDNTMRVLKQLMPAADYTKLCNNINRAREVNSSSDDYISPTTYAPMTVGNYVSKLSKKLSHAGNSEIRNAMAQILAVRQIAREKNPEHPFKEMVVTGADKKHDEELIKQRAAQIKRDPAFISMVNAVKRMDDRQKKMYLDTMVSDAGNSLEYRYDQEKKKVMNADNTQQLLKDDDTVKGPELS